jgi:predicted transcriptional regulator
LIGRELRIHGGMLLLDVQASLGALQFQLRLHMFKLSQKETEILRFIRSSRHKTTVQEIARGLNLSPNEVQVFVQGLLGQKLLNLAPGTKASDDAYYTNPERREEIYELLG